MKILLIEDEKPLSDALCQIFSKKRWETFAAYNGETGLDEALTGIYDIILLDIMLPGADGYELLDYCKALDVPVIFLTALGGEEDMLRGYALGCDDYVTKPFSLAVLLAKTRALIRRSGGGTGVLTCGAIALDPARRLCTVRGQAVKLPEQLLDKVWGLDFQGDDRAVDVRVRSLRAALGEAGGQIKTVFKAGYRLEEV